MSTEHDLKLAKLASGLLADLNNVDDTVFIRAVADQQKGQLITEAFEQVTKILVDEYQAAEKRRLNKSRPSSLYDHGA